MISELFFFFLISFIFLPFMFNIGFKTYQISLNFANLNIIKIKS